MQKKVLSMILVLCMLLGLFPYAVLGTAAADSSAEYTVISTADELIALMGDSSKWSGNYRLGDSIDLTGKTGQAPIGDDTVPFTGIFDGNEKSISGIDITVDGRKGVGFFGIIRDAEVRDLTVSGQVTATGANFSGGLIGAITGNATVENCVSNITVKAVSRVGGIVGGIVLNNALGTAEGTELDAAATATVVVRNCVNNATVTASATGEARTGGVVGAVSIGKVGTRNATVENCVNNAAVTSAGKYIAGVVGYADANIAGASLVINGCTNNGSVSGASSVGGVFGHCNFTAASTNLTISNCVNGADAVVKGTATSATLVGGIAGRITLPSGGTAVTTITRCANLGTVTAPAQVGGIVGYTMYAGTTISECYNIGSVTGSGTATGGADAGGILGLANSGVVENCINTGAVTGTSNKNVGGIVGRTAGTCTIRYNYNAGTTTSGTSTNCAAICGGKAGTVTYTNNYYSVGNTDANGTLVAEADLADSSKYTGFDATIWTFTTTGPELTYFHEHVDADGDNACDTCGANLACTHPTTELEVVTPATCVATGVGRETCTVCGNIEEVVLPIDPDNHVSELTLSLVDGKIVYTCACGVTYAETTDAVSTVYVAASGVASLPTATAGTSDNPFGDFDLAMQYAGLVASANGAATVVIADSITVPATYSTPTFDGTVTVTGGTMVFASGCAFEMNGAMTFRDIAFDTAKTGSGAYIYAQNHKLVMDTGIQMVNTGAKSTLDSMEINGVKLYVLGGFLNSATASYTLDTDVTVRSGEYWFIGGANRNAAGTMTVEGTTKVTLGTVNDTDTLKIAWLNTFSTGSEHVGAAALKGTMIFDGVVDAARYNIVSQNGGGAEYDRTVDIVLMGDINPNYGSVIDVVGSTAVKGCAVDLYVDERVDTAVADADVFYGDSADASIATLELVVSKYTYTQYCVNYLDGHTDADEDGTCDICGASMQCDHPEASLEYRTIIASTCSTQGLEEVWCTQCGQKVTENVLDFDFMLHTALHYVYNEETELYDLACSDCGETVAESYTEPVVYLDNWAKTGSTGLTAEIGSDLNFGDEATVPVQTLEEAVRRLATTGGKIFSLDRYVIEGDLELPAYEKEITLTTPEGTTTGFVITKHGALLSLGGPTKFEKLIFNGGSSTANPSDGGYYNTLVIEGNWNDVTFGTGLGTFGNAYFIAGEQYPKADDDAQKDVHLTFTETTASKISDSQAAVTFFDRIYLGSRVNATGITVSNKTVTADFVASTTAINVYAGTTSTAAQNAQMVNCSTTMNFYANAYIQYIRNGDGNTTSAGTAYLDNLTVNLYDSSRIMAAFVPRNVRNLTLNISGTEDGRTLYNPKQFGLIELTSGYLASENYTGSETLTMNYTTHSFTAGVEAPTYSEQYAVQSNVVDECAWNDGEITTPATPEADGVKTYTCTICGATKTESVPFACTDHNYIAKADGTYYCTVCSETFTELPTADLTLAAAPATIADGKAVVTLKLTAESFWGVRFKVTAPEGFTLESAVSSLPEAAEGDGTGSGLSFAQDGNSMTILGFSTNPTNTSIDQVVVTLTYTVDDTVDTSVAQVVDVDIVEALRVGEGDEADVEISATAVGAEVTVAEHTHEYTATVTKEATCVEDGVMTYTCVCGDSYTEAIPATGKHTYTSAVTKEATCGEDGVMTYTCTVCGDSYTEAIPATGEHTYGEWVETTPAQPGVAGEETRACTVCGATETRATEPLPETYVAYIGETGYATVQAAMDAANVLDTITVADGTVETVTPSKAVYLAGDYSGVTLSGDYTLVTTGRYKFEDGKVVTDATIKFNYTAKAVVLPNTEASGVPVGGQSLNLGASVEYNYVPRKTHVDSFAEFVVKYELLGTDGKSVEEGSEDASAVTLTIADSTEYKVDTARYVYVLDGVPAKCMNNTIRITTYGINADGSVVVGTKDWGAYVYLQSLLSGTGSLRELAAALTNFGALAQLNFNYNTDNLLSDLLPEAERKLTTADYADVAMAKQLNYTSRTDANDQFEAFATSLQLIDRINIDVTVKSKVGSSTDYTGVKAVYSYADAVTGNTITGEIPFEEWTVGAVDTKGRTAYTFHMNDISARNLRQLISLDIVNADGTSIYSLQELSFNAAENYCSTQAGQTTPLAAVCYGIMNYCDKAIAYFAQ